MRHMDSNVPSSLEETPYLPTGLLVGGVLKDVSEAVMLVVHPNPDQPASVTVELEDHPSAFGESTDGVIPPSGAALHFVGPDGLDGSGGAVPGYDAATKRITLSGAPTAGSPIFLWLERRNRYSIVTTAI